MSISGILLYIFFLPFPSSECLSKEATFQQENETTNQLTKQENPPQNHFCLFK